MYVIDKITVLTNTVLAAGASKSIVVWANTATAGASDGIVEMYGHVRNVAASGGAARTLSAFAPAVELEPGGGYTTLASNVPALGLNYDGGDGATYGVIAANIDSWGRFTIKPVSDTITTPSYAPCLDISSLKFLATAGASDVYLDILLYVRRVPTHQNYARTPSGSWA